VADPDTDDMPDDGLTAGRIERLISSAASVVAPLSLLTALLFYFGYASARAQYDYFGIDVDTIGMSTQDYVMRSPAPLLTPLLTFVLLGVALATLHESLRRRVQGARSAAEGTDSTAPEQRRLRRWRALARGLTVGGWATLLVGVGLLLAYSYLAPRWGYYPLITPVVMAVGAGLALYGRRVARLLGDRQGFRPVVLLLALVLATNVFWATATFAEWSGRGTAMELADHLERLPSVILDTTEQLHLTSPGIEESVLRTAEGAPADGQTYFYRYRGLRLLIQGSDRLFLVPGGTWSASNSTLVVPLDSSVRLQFRFRNLPP
jgi:hypothetical protein